MSNLGPSATVAEQEIFDGIAAITNRIMVLSPDDRTAALSALLDGLDHFVLNREEWVDLHNWEIAPLRSKIKAIKGA